MKHLGKTAPFRGPKGEILPGSIAEIIPIELPRPRDARVRVSPEFMTIVAEIGRLIGLDYL